MLKTKTTLRSAPWVKKKIGPLSNLHKMKKILRESNLHTVCESANCPNIGECFSKPTATFMILGDVCTRSCTFCSVDKKGSPLNIDKNEPRNIALTSKKLGLKHIVVTSVTRDDLPDFGAGHFAETIKELKKELPMSKIEVLTPDFMGDNEALEIVLTEKPHIFNHNVETVPSLYKQVRPKTSFERSLNVLKRAKEFSENNDFNIKTKSGIMVGFGETKEEVKEVLRDLKNCNIDAVTIGQYLRPTAKHIEVKEYITEVDFKEYEDYGLSLGIEKVYSGSFVRSSYNAKDLF